MAKMPQFSNPACRESFMPRQKCLGSPLRLVISDWESFTPIGTSDWESCTTGVMYDGSHLHL